MASFPPSVNELAESFSGSGLPHPLLVQEIRKAIDQGDWENLETRIQRLKALPLQTVINATGVLLHTNLGRAPWPNSSTGHAINVELDLTTGLRGSRQEHVGNLFATLCGSEAAMVVNNCSSAVLLVLSALASGKGVAISRSEMVEIGGNFRVPDVLELSGAYLVEVGTTNRTRKDDYERAISANKDVAMMMKIHQSNYKIVGFTESTDVAELSDMGIPLVADIGSGLLDENCPWLDSGPPAWINGEPAAKQTLEQGADLITFSGDKLLGGPQAGIIAGRADLIGRCMKHPFARAVRPGGLILSSLQELAMRYLTRDWEAIPFWKMAVTTVNELEQRANRIGIGTPVPLNSIPGGGTLPEVVIPSFGLQLNGDVSHKLRLGTDENPPIIARVEDGNTFLDLRTVDPLFDDQLSSALHGIS
ncbi:MAG: L-seryl-tRNA(Sec) selenium transferase [Acidimicrobiales bacterium]|jgi:L-seryl-tRNA(Ser) seleniumtransferase|nr:L-seryl-tRNA(Sec) selenium transferase [Acidimicrobiales bacterium]HJM97993.1 L-seryl-tRNA(Sec) selenium transferase [Acidimicrobiales bacterium]